MWKRLFRKKKDDAKADLPEILAGERDTVYIELRGRTVQRKLKPVTGASILELAERGGVDWNSHCRRGTCARCRSYVAEGSECLTEPNEAETARLDEEEIAEGYRLGCQARVARNGRIVVKHAPYF